jgi:hypothetical protein
VAGKGNETRGGGEVDKKGSDFLPLSQAKRVKKMRIGAFTRMLEDLIAYVVVEIAQRNPTVSPPVLLLFAVGYAFMVSRVVLLVSRRLTTPCRALYQRGSPRFQLRLYSPSAWALQVSTP